MDEGDRTGEFGVVSTADSAHIIHEIRVAKFTKEMSGNLNVHKNRHLIP
jgi:hypothetical protein